MTLILNNAEQIRKFRLFTLLKAAELEAKGMRRSRGPSALSILKREYGFRGSRAKVIESVQKALS